MIISAEESVLDPISDTAFCAMPGWRKSASFDVLRLSVKL
jgi:hypothetical protein